MHGKYTCMVPHTITSSNTNTLKKNFFVGKILIIYILYMPKRYKKEVDTNSTLAFTRINDKLGGGAHFTYTPLLTTCCELSRSI